MAHHTTITKPSIRPQRFPWPAAGALALLLYWLCLRFLFPGYFAPLSPFHVDFYDYTAVAHNTLLQLVTRFPRPAAFLAMHFMGQADLAGLMTAEVILALGNVLLTVRLAQQLFRPDAMWMLAALPTYLILLFAHPQFYFEHRHDLPAQVSYFWLCLSLLAWISWARFQPPHGMRRPFVLAAALGSGLLFAFSKETYFVSALIMMFGIALVDRKQRFRHLSFAAFQASAEIASFLRTRYLNSPFAGSLSDPANTYHVSVRVASLARTGGFYLARLFNPALILLCLFVLLAVKRNRECFVLAAAFMAAGCAALLPHAILPNHRFAEYAWAAAPLLLAPVLLLGSVARSLRLGVSQLAMLAVLTLTAVAGPKGYQSVYHSDSLQWLVAQDHRGAALARSFPLFHALPPSSHILIVGLDEPDIPWQRGDFVRAEFGDRAYWTVILPANVERHNSRSVRIAAADSVQLENYDYVATYQPDGNLTSFRDARTLAGSAPRAEVLVPQLIPLLTATRRHPADSTAWMRCAAVAVDWGLWTEAADYLDRARNAGGSLDPEFVKLQAAVRNRPQESAAPSGKLSANPLHMVAPDDLGDTELSWTISDDLAVEIHVDAPDGPLFAAGNQSGHARAEKWVKNGMRFFLQDVTGGKPLTPENTLAMTTVEVSR